MSDWKPPYFGSAHPLAGVAARQCEHPRPQIGRTACGECWESAIRADERVVLQFELPSAVKLDPEYVDPIAVEIACSGSRRVGLTEAEQAVAIARLSVRGLPPTSIAHRLGVRPEVVTAVLAPVEHPSVGELFVMDRHARRGHEMAEAGLSDCRFGCKVFRCTCGVERVEHMASYGCPGGRAELGRVA
jgi:hypothetical protein